MVALGETLEEAFHYIFNVQLACETQVRVTLSVFNFKHAAELQITSQMGRSLILQNAWSCGIQ